MVVVGGGCRWWLLVVVVGGGCTTPEPGASGPKLTQPILRGDLHD